MNPDGNKELFREIVNKADEICLLMHKTHREVDSKTLSKKFDEYIERLNKCIKEIKKYSSEYKQRNLEEDLVSLKN